MMQAVSKARHHSLKAYLAPDHVALASVNSPMQCMMKEICAQCLQRHVCPDTGRISYVFSCANQDQLQDHIDWQHLHARLGQNRLAEQISDLYLSDLLAQAALSQAASTETSGLGLPFGAQGLTVPP